MDQNKLHELGIAVLSLIFLKVVFQSVPMNIHCLLRLEIKEKCSSFAYMLMTLYSLEIVFPCLKNSKSL